MSLLGGFFGAVISVPLTWMAAPDITVNRVVAYPLGHHRLPGDAPDDWPILFVTVLGFGMLSGTVETPVMNDLEHHG